MEIPDLLEQLAGPDHRAASDALVAIGAPAVLALTAGGRAKGHPPGALEI